jgi:hypothetical protein
MKNIETKYQSLKLYNEKGELTHQFWIKSPLGFEVGLTLDDRGNELTYCFNERYYIRSKRVTKKVFEAFIY